MNKRTWFGLLIAASVAWTFTALGCAIDPRRAGFAYLFAFCTGFTAASGAPTECMHGTTRL